MGKAEDDKPAREGALINGTYVIFNARHNDLAATLWNRRIAPNEIVGARSYERCVTQHWAIEYQAIEDAYLIRPAVYAHAYLTYNADDATALGPHVTIGPQQTTWKIIRRGPGVYSLEAQDVGSRVVAEATGPKHANIRLVKWQNDTTVEQHWRFQAVA